MMPFICSCKVRVELNRNMKSLGVLESKRDPIRKPLKLVRHLIEEQDKVLLSYFAQKGRMWSKRVSRGNYKGREHVQVGHVCVKMARADRGQVTKS